jgi:hypothetical protein
VKSGERRGRLDFAKLIEQADSVRPNTNRTKQESNPKRENPKDHNDASTELRKQVAAAEQEARPSNTKMTTLNFDDTEKAALVALLTAEIESSCYLLSPRAPRPSSPSWCCHHPRPEPFAPPKAVCVRSKM